MIHDGYPPGCGPQFSWQTWPGWLAALLAVLPFVVPASALADPPAAAGVPRQLPEGRFITVPSPLTTTAVNHVIATTNRFVQSHPHRRLCMVYDFNPDAGPSATAEFGPCYDLSKFLLGLQDVNTVAFVHNRVGRHTVLPVLACQEIVMAGTDATRLGPVLP